MTEPHDEKVGEIVRFGLGARNWLFAQLGDTENLYNWQPPTGGRTVEEILTHIAWVISAVCSHIAEELKIELHQPQIEEEDNSVARLKSEVNAAYNMFTTLCEHLDTEMLDRIIQLPAPSRVRENSVERVLRIMTGYHVIHHAGQVAMILRMARDAR